ncbi:MULTISPECIES: glycosyltransferase [Enterococcus]|uniref:glycosyltransferase n=1 Tax=Enterococcus TaxID=1350 RepID=UPI0003128A4F|nr:glycosyltransferase [Enterococcus mundtii]MBO1085869.1 glycosyltransferase [Enterococcus mundtii]MDB7100975.1 glycosyltransferase [Enterococcus mundtii]
MSLALCLMMKNEEEFLDNFFRNCFADAIYVLDTGSTDKSIQIAQKYTTNIYSKPFNNDFSAMRNYLLEQVEEDWIIFLDADELLLKADWNTIRQYIESNSDDSKIGGYRFLRYNFFGTGGWYSDSMVKLFRNHCGFKYYKKATEKIEPSIKCKGFCVDDIPVTLNHLGHMRSFKERQRKNEMYIQIMNEQILNNPKETLAKSYLAIIQRNAGKLKLAKKNAQEAAEANPNSEIAQLFLGYIFRSENNIHRSKAQFKKVLIINPRNTRALNSLGVTELCCGNYETAREFFEKAFEISPLCIHIYINIGLTYFFSENYFQALSFFKHVLEINPYFGIATTQGILEMDFYKSHYYETIPNYWGLRTYITICEKELENDGFYFFYK